MRFIYFLLSLFGLLACEQTQNFDILILNGKLFDGMSQEFQLKDLGIVGDEIVALGDLKNHQAQKKIDAKGIVVSPGFVDLHAHLDPIFELSDCESHIRQGVTTALGGPDGGGPWPFGAYLDSLAQHKTGLNVGFLVGHNRVRRNVMELDNRAPTEEELARMKAQISTAMDEGAFGISTGLKYLPGTFSKVEEVIELSRVAAEKGGFYTSHLREEGLGLLGGVQEAILISEKAQIPVVLTHHKVVGKPMWGSSIKNPGFGRFCQKFGTGYHDRPISLYCQPYRDWDIDSQLGKGWGTESIYRKNKQAIFARAYQIANSF